MTSTKNEQDAIPRFPKITLTLSNFCEAFHFEQISAKEAINFRSPLSHTNHFAAMGVESSTELSRPFQEITNC